MGLHETRRGPWSARGLTLAAAAVAMAATLASCSKTDSATPPSTTAGPVATLPPATVGGTIPLVTTSSTTTPVTKPTVAPTTEASPTTTPAAPTTAGPPASPTTAAPVPTDPATLAQALFARWKAGDKDGAERLAEPDAVDTLFAQTFPTVPAPGGPEDAYVFKNCSGAAGSTICVFDAKNSELQMEVRNATGGLPVTVIGVTFTQGAAGP
jgi:hypothetical protein